jgi:hypothetical protein
MILEFAEKASPPGVDIILKNYINPALDFTIKGISLYMINIDEDNKRYAEYASNTNEDIFLGGIDWSIYKGRDNVRSFIETVYRNPRSIKITGPEWEKAISFFHDNRSRFNKFLHGSMPDPQKNPDSFMNWIELHKDEVYILLYGSVDTPKKKE